MFSFFFFQAEDGIRDSSVTGVQTCALPISHERVREEGKVALPLLHDVQAAGLSPRTLAEQIQARLKEYINVPRVTVAVEETHPMTVPVLGEVAHPGQYPLERGAGVLEALAAGGGLTEFAHRDRIFVLRRHPAPVRIRSTFEALSRGQGRAAAVRLAGRDPVVLDGCSPPPRAPASSSPP